VAKDHYLMPFFSREKKRKVHYSERKERLFSLKGGGGERGATPKD